MMNCPRTDDYEYYCTDIVAWNCYRFIERLTTFTTFKNAYDFCDFRLLRFLDSFREDIIKKWRFFDQKMLKNRTKWGFSPILWVKSPNIL